MSDAQQDDTAGPNAADRSARLLHCPQCAAAMEQVPFRDITVDRCTACRGLWFDALEREHLDAMSGAEGIDVGNAAAPPVAAATACPVCHSRLIGMVEPGRPDLHYQSCTVCYGIFSPAGEYREHKAADEHPALHLFHRLFHRTPSA